MRLGETRYLVRDPETGSYLSGGGPYARFFSGDQVQADLELAFLFRRKSNARAAITKGKKTSWGETQEAFQRAVIIPASLTIEFEP